MKLNYLPRLLFLPDPALSAAEVAKELAKQQKAQQELNESVNYFATSLRNTVEDLTKQNNLVKDVVGSYRQLTKEADKLKYDQLDIAKLSERELKAVKERVEKSGKVLEDIVKQKKQERDRAAESIQSLEKQIKAQGASTKQQKEQLSVQKKIVAAYDEAGDFITQNENGYKELLKTVEKRLDKEKDINKNLGVSGVLLKSATSYLSNLGVSGEILDDMEKKLRNLATTQKVTAKDVVKVVGEAAAEAIQDPIVKFGIGLKLAKSGWNDLVSLFKKGFEIAKEYNSTIVESARSIGMADKQMERLSTEASFSGYTLKQVTKAIVDMNEQLGITVDFGAESTKEFAAMTNQMGLTANEASNIQKISLLNNQTLEDTDKTIASTIITQRKANEPVLNARQVFQEIGKLSAGILVKFQQNPKALTEAVVAAKKLGTSLEEIDKIGDSMLNFESSIQSQMEAELLTGKALNLEKARYAALTGDQLTLEKEIGSQVGSLADYQKLNVIAQKSLAQAFGMSREEMAKMLQQQEVYKKLGDVSNKSAQEQLDIARQRGIPESDSLVMTLKQQSATEKLAAIWDDIQQSLAKLLQGPLGLIVNAFKFIADHSWAAYTAIGLMALIDLGKLIAGVVMMADAWGSSATAAGIVNFFTKKQATDLAVVATEEAGIALAKDNQAVAAVTVNAAETFGIGTLAVVAAVAAAVGALGTMAIGHKFAEGGIVTGEINNATVGEAGPEAIIPLNSPKAGKMLGGVLGGGGDMTSVVNAIVELRTSINALASRPVQIQVDGQTLANTVAKNVPTSYGNLLNPSSRVYGG